MKPNIVLTTITRVPNYGASLQAYASRQVLERFGDVTILEYDNPVVRRSRALIRSGPSAKNLLSAGKDILRFRSRARLLEKFKTFYDYNLGLSESLTLDQIQNTKKKIDFCISGSDQIWNPQCVSDEDKFDDTYFLSFAPQHSRCIAFSSSMGGYQCRGSKLVELARLLSRFDAISVREQDTKILLEQILGRSVRHSLDPTLHLNSSTWSDLVKNFRADVPEDFILAYTVPRLKRLARVSKQVASCLELPIVSIDGDPFPLVDTRYQINDAGPIDFLELFQRAKFVVTDSFHGVCFAITYRLPFLAVTTGPHASRITSLLTMLGLEGRLVREDSIPNEALKAINYHRVHSRLIQEREKDIAFLEESIAA